MERKIWCLGIIFIVIIALVACESNENGVKEKSKNQEKVTDVAQEQISKEVETSGEELGEEAEKSKDPLASTKEALTFLYRENISSFGSGEEYPENQSKTLKRELLDIAEKGHYGELIERGKSLSEKYQFSRGDNLDIAGIFHDAKLIGDIFGVENDMTKYGEVVALSKTPEMLIISALYSDNFARRPVIEDMDSLGPVGFSTAELGSQEIFKFSEDAKDEPIFNNHNIVEDIFSIHDDALEVYAYDLTIPDLDNGLPLRAYVWEDLYGNLFFYGMYAPDGFKTYEKPLSWWIEQDILFENAEKQQEQYDEDNGERGVITEEQIDKLFESDW